MLPFSLYPEKYTRLPRTSDLEGTDCDIEIAKEITQRKASRRWHFIKICLLLLACVVGSTFFFEIGRLYPDDGTVSTGSSSCRNPKRRHEWRTLSTKQQYEYLNALKCLQSVPSKLHPGMTLYDDFPFLHDVVGDYAHETAAFLTWHRYFIHLFERELKDKCGYTGGLTYWDWTLDWEDLSRSPIFKSSPGFGGNSNPNSEPSKVAIVGGDRCLQDGPFAGTTVHWWTQEGQSHCLSRGFQDVVPIEEMGKSFRPGRIEKILQQPDYESFFLNMEHTIHNGIQVAIGGDIMYNTAPYDPIFYLHHTQLDRIWWLWQQIHPSHQWQYLGLANNHSDDRASLYNIIDMGDFAPGLAALDLMDTKSDLLCYRY
ncbi:hypothetical protein F5884DRAFT_786519 [Xylogone sp. PMI_703]|nr:hypothetical protein F5884DRAFT_786519 [Xylogone sp. PMI_703]